MKINTIICGDAEKILKEIPERSIHLIITSPPYNVGMPYQNYNDRQDLDKYMAKMRNIFTECYRILVKGGRICVNLPSAAQQSSYSRVSWLAIDYIVMLRKIGFLDREMIAWIKSEHLSVRGKSTSWGSWMSASCPYLRDIHEWIIVMHKETKVLEGKQSDITKEEFLEWTHNVWRILPNTAMRRFHPAPFPIELPTRLVKLYSFVGQTVLDPFCGIGTTCIAAKRHNRNYIGIDISPEYCNRAKLLLGQNFLYKEEV